MSGIGKWSLGIGLVALGVCVAMSLASVVPVAAGAGIAAFLGLGIAGYDAVYEWLGRYQIRRAQRRNSQS